MSQSAGRPKASPAKTTPPQAQPPVEWYDRSGWKGIKAVVELCGIVGGVISVAFVGYSLWDAQRTQRIEHSLALVNRFNDATLSQATETLRRATLEMNEQLEMVGQNAGFDPDTIKAAAEMLTSSADDHTRANQAALIAFARFFDETEICVNLGLCDRQTICDYLVDTAREVDSTLGAGLDAFNVRSGSKPVGVGFRKVANEMCSVPAAQNGG